MPLTGLRVLTLESRRAKDMETLIGREGGIAIVAPSVQERSLEGDGTALRFIEDLEAGRYDLVICMTGVGLGFLRDTLLQQGVAEERIGSALRRATIVSRGPKPVGILRSLGVPVHVTIPEPNTWREIVAAIAGRPERRIAVQEYGRPNVEMTAALEAVGAAVSPVALYRWELPADTGPLENAARELAGGRIDVVLFTSSIQLDHLFEIASRLGIADCVRKALATGVAIGSVGPVMSDSLRAHGLTPDFEPRHPKMWALVKAASELAPESLARKRR